MVKANLRWSRKSHIQKIAISVAILAVISIGTNLVSEFKMQLPLMRMGQSCKVAVGVFSRASHTARRDIIRKTWGTHITETSGALLLFVAVWYWTKRKGK